MPAPKQSDATFEEINQLIWKHLEDRDWHKLPSRSLVISLALEANELLEHYQWQDQPVGSKDELASELADIVIYAFEFAQQNNINIAQAVKQKLEKTAKKYPAAQFKGKAGDDRYATWLTAKKEYRKEETL